MVTGCDNLLDDEYKKTLETELPEQGYRFRSILDIMASDRILFQILLESGPEHRLTREQVLSASTASLQSLGRSGAQEASEENGITHILKPDDILKSVHHFKTGVLFQCTWAVPLAIEPIEKSTVSNLLDALYKIGMGCQIMDDMVDFYADLQQKRHNYIVSLIYHKFNPAGRSRLLELSNRNLEQQDISTALNEFPEVRPVVEQTALGYLEAGLKMLLREDHRFLTAPAIEFMAKRIGANRLMTVFE
jgi:geranylgeranyl pyrophosphate synthase